MLGTLIGGIILLVMLAAIFAILISVFWIWMLIDCLKRGFKNDNDKIVWVLVIVFLSVLGAAIYYFVVKINDKKTVRKK